MYHDALLPGDAVQPGLYWVYHYQHRLAHLCRVRLTHLPLCARCGDKVRFRPADTGASDAASWLRHDFDFQETTAGIPLHPDPLENGASA